MLTLNPDQPVHLHSESDQGLICLPIYSTVCRGSGSSKEGPYQTAHAQADLGLHCPRIATCKEQHIECQAHGKIVETFSAVKTL